MKKFTFLCALIVLGLTVVAQVPQAFKYQAVARELNGDPLINQQISVKISILAGSPEGEVVYSELHETITNNLGLFGLEIGNPTQVLTGSFDGIDWGGSSHFLETAIDLNGSGQFQVLGVMQFLSVPYALFSEKTGDTTAWQKNEDAVYYNHGQVGVGTGQPDNSALIELKSTEKGFLPPRMNTAQRDAIGSPTAGLIVFNLDCNDLQLFNGTGWVSVSNAGGLVTPDPITGNINPWANSDGVIYSVAPVSGASGYNWTVPTDAVITSGQGTTIITVNFGNSNGDICVSAYKNCSRSIMNCLEVDILEGSPVAVAITASANPVCAGTSVTFTATPTNGGSAPAYQWLVNGDSVSGATDPNYSFVPLDGDVITCALTSNLPDAMENPATSNTLTMIVNPLLSVGVSIYATENPVCAGTSATFIATPTNGGSLPSYQWIVNGIPVTEPSNANYSFVPVNNDTVSCLFTSNELCVSGNPATSNEIVLTVNPPLPVSVSITALENPVNAGTTVTFTATPVNGGSSPIYLWKVNGLSVGSNTPTFFYVPSNNDIITCIMTSTLPCVSGNPATSNQIVMSVLTMGFPCPGTPSISFGGQTYNTVQIGSQCWLKENLNIGTRKASNSNQTNNGTIEKYCFENTEANCDVYGGLYQWSEMMSYSTTPGVQGICPTGWHVPTDVEWCTVTTYLDATVNCAATGFSGTNAGGKMKEIGTAHWASPNTGATNSSGFTGLPVGLRMTNGGFYPAGIYCHFWSSTAYSTTNAWYLHLLNTRADLLRGNDTKLYGFSVRCLKD